MFCINYKESKNDNSSLEILPYNTSAKRSHWLPVKFCCQYKLLMYVFKGLHGTAPIYLQELLNVYKQTRSLRSVNTNRLQVPKVKTKSYGHRRFDMASAVLWNNLPSDIRMLETIDTFKSRLKTHLFKLAYSDFL